jgi:DNA-binding response OmpR family regulator
MMAKVLLIEDDSAMLLLLGKLLRFEGFDVAQLEDDEDLDRIISAVRREKPAAILLDVHLRQINGFDLLRCIRLDQDLKDTRVIMASGMDFRKRCLEEGADGFLLKPFMPDELIEKIHQAVGTNP